MLLSISLFEYHYIVFFFFEIFFIEFYDLVTMILRACIIIENYFILKFVLKKYKLEITVSKIYQKYHKILYFHRIMEIYK